MGSKMFLLLGLSFAIVLLISSDITTAMESTEASSSTNGNIDREDGGGHWGGHGHGGHGGGHGGGGGHWGGGGHGGGGGHWGGGGHGGGGGHWGGGGHGGGGCRYGYCRHHCCRYAGEAEAQVQPHN